MIKASNKAELNFDIEKEIGLEGKNSKVYKARDVQLDAIIAIKAVKKSAFSSVDEYFKEASLLYLTSHPNIVPVHYACQDADSVFLAMPFYASGSLKSKLARGHLSIREIVTISTEVLSGLHNIHSKGLIHFDVKPDNVLLGLRGEAKLSDFGLAKQTCFAGRAGQDRIYSKMVPPEGLGSSTFTRSFDIYQFGLTLHRMCVGDTVFYKEYATYCSAAGLDIAKFKHAVRNGQFPSKTAYLEHVPQRIIDTIKKCLSTDPLDRPLSALEVVNLLSDVDGNLLDWQYREKSGKRIWSKIVNNTKILLEVDSSGASYATKQIGTSKPRRIASYCVSSIGRAEIKSFLREN